MSRPRPVLLDAIARRLAGEPGKKVPYDRVLSICQAEMPALRDAPDRSAQLLALLECGQTEGRWRLPRELRLWLPGRPSLPSWVMLKSPATVAMRDEEDTTWVPLLGFAGALRKRSEREHARCINAWLREHPDPSMRVPSRERSLQIFGDEKKLDSLGGARGSLFGGRLSLADLACFTAPLPLPYELPATTATGAPLLVVENHHSYWSFCEWNRDRGVYAAVAYGSGEAFKSAAHHLDQIRRRSAAGSLEYIGDIDPKGLAIACDVDRQRRGIGLEPLNPAHNWYRWLLDHGRRRRLRAQQLRALPEPQRLHDWLGEALASEVEALFGDGEWLPQEALGLEALMASGNELAQG